MLNLGLPLLLLALSGCTEEAPPAPPLKPKPPPSKVEEAPEAEADPSESAAPAPLGFEALPETLPAPGAGLEGFDKVRSLTAARQYREAVPQILGLLSGTEVDSETWLLLRWTALDPQAAADLVDKLDAEQALAGDPQQHFGTRSRLARDGERGADATSAAQRLRKEDPELGAVAMAWAVLAGAKHPDPRSLDQVRAEDALVLAANTPMGRRSDLLTQADSLESWQARVLVAAMSPADQAIAAAEAVPAEPEAQLALASALLERSDLPRAQIAPFLAAGAEAADALGLGEQSLSLGQAAISARLHAHDALGATALAQTLMQGRLDAGDGSGGALLSRSAVDAALRAGDLRQALELARLGERMGELAEDKPAQQQGAWALARAARAARDTTELSRAIPLLEGAERSAAEAMLAGLQGQAEPKALQPPRGMPWPESVDLSLQWAEALEAQGQNPEPAYQSAVSAADLDGANDLRLGARLSWLEATGSARALASLAELSAELELPELQAELAAREVLAGGSPQLPETLDESWTGVLDLSLPQTEGPASALAKARVMVDKQDGVGAAQAYRAHFAAQQPHRVGPWSSLSVQDGHHAGSLNQDAQALVALGSAAVPGLLALHDFDRDRRAMRSAFAVGDDPAASLSAEDALALHQAYATERAHTLRWLLGGPSPQAARDKAQSLYEQARTTPAFARALPAPQPELEALLEKAGKSAILSLRLSPEGGEVLAIAGDLMSVHTIDKPDAVQSDALALRKHLAAGETAEALLVGNRLRQVLLDAPGQTLAGKGRYLLLVDGALASISPKVFPESQEGLRYLADIRTITMAASAGQAMLPQGEAPERYAPEFFGLSAADPQDVRASDGSLISPEVVQVAHRFDKDLRVLQQGAEIEVASFAETAQNSRFLHLVPDGLGPGASLRFGDQTLSLAQVRAVDLSAVTVILSVELEPNVGARWVQTLRGAGANSVVLRSWELPTDTRSKFFFSSYEGLIQHGDPNRAFQQTRKSLSDDQALLGDDGPRWWGSYLVFGHP